MSIITKSGTPSKGSPTEFTLNKSELEAVSSVAGDTYFSDPLNWKSVFLVYQSTVGGQSEIIKFNASQNPCTANFEVSDKARNVFEIKKIIIKDFDEGSFEILRSELVAGDFDVDFSGTVVPNYIQYDLYSAVYLPTLTLNGGVGGGSPFDYDLVKSSSFFPTGNNFSCVFEIDWSGSPSSGNMFVGISQFSDIVDYTFPSPSTNRAFGLLQVANNSGVVTAHIIQDGYPVFFNIIIQTPGTNHYKIEFDGIAVSHYINDILIYSDVTPLYDAYPTVRTMGFLPCNASYKL